MFWGLQDVTVGCRGGLVSPDLQIWETLSRIQLARCVLAFSFVASPKTTNICSACLMSPGVQPNVLMHNLVKEHAALASCFQHEQDDQQIYKLLKPQCCCSPYNTLSQDKLDSTGLLLKSNWAPSPHLRAGLLQLLGSLVSTWVATIGQPSLPSCGDIPLMPPRCPQPCTFSLFLFWRMFWTVGRWV